MDTGAMTRAAIRAELRRALDDMRLAMAEVAREGDTRAYQRLAERYALLWARWEQWGPIQMGPREDDRPSTPTRPTC